MDSEIYGAGRYSFDPVFYWNNFTQMLEKTKMEKRIFPGRWKAGGEKDDLLYRPYSAVYFQ